MKIEDGLKTIETAVRNVALAAFAVAIAEDFAIAALLSAARIVDEEDGSPSSVVRDRFASVRHAIGLRGEFVTRELQAAMNRTEVRIRKMSEPTKPIEIALPDKSEPVEFVTKTRGHTVVEAAIDKAKADEASASNVRTVAFDPLHSRVVLSFETSNQVLEGEKVEVWRRPDGEILSCTVRPDGDRREKASDREKELERALLDARTESGRTRGRRFTREIVVDDDSDPD